jgi:hypothetical protein
MRAVNVQTGNWKSQHRRAAAQFNQSIQRMGASRSVHFQIERHGRLALTADARC